MMMPAPNYFPYHISNHEVSLFKATLKGKQHHLVDKKYLKDIHTLRQETVLVFVILNLYISKEF